MTGGKGTPFARDLGRFRPSTGRDLVARPRAFDVLAVAEVGLYGAPLAVVVHGHGSGARGRVGDEVSDLRADLARAIEDAADEVRRRPGVAVDLDVEGDPLVTEGAVDLVVR